MRLVPSRDRLIWPLLALASIIRLAALFQKGVTYDGGFEDAMRFMDSARILAHSGNLSFAGTARSAYQMPGFAGFLSIFVSLTADPFRQYLLVKLATVLVSVASIYVLYLLGKRIGGVEVGLLAAALLTVSLPHIYTGTLTLSENPFMLALLATTLFLIRLADSPSWRNLAFLLAAFCAALLLKQAAMGFLPPALVYVLARRYPPRLLFKHGAAAALVVTLVLAPWVVRNYTVFHAFVPFSSYSGAPLYEGTFQRFQPYGTGSFEAMAKLLATSRGSEYDKSRLMAQAARSRIASRWRQDPVGLIVTYAVMKPAAAWLLPFYWDKVFGISGYWVLRLHALASVVGAALLVLFAVWSKRRREFLLLLLNVGVITVGAAYYLGLSRYVYPYVPFLSIASAYAAVSVWKRARAIDRLPAEIGDHLSTAGRETPAEDGDLAAS